jgi:hypothetical protein
VNAAAAPAGGAKIQVRAQWRCPECGARGWVGFPEGPLDELWDRFARSHGRKAPACTLDDHLMLIWVDPDR